MSSVSTCLTQRRHVGIAGELRNVSGYRPPDLMDNGLEFVMSIFQKDDFQVYNENIFGQVIDTLKTIPHSEHEEYVFSFNYRMQKADKSWMHLYQQGSYITDPVTHLPLFSIALVTDISPVKRDTCMVFSIDRKEKDKSQLHQKNLLTQYHYPNPEESKLSKREREVLAWMAEGLSSKQIAVKLFVSESTIVAHRKNMLKKANAKSSSELIRYGIQRGLI